MKTMKKSGIPWIKEIPLDWETCRVSDAFFRKNRKAYQLEPTILTLARSGIKIRDISSNEGQIAESYYEYNPVSKNDLLLNPMDLQSGDNCSISKVEGVISPAYINLRHKNNICPDFYNYLFKVYYWTKALFTYGKGVSFDNRWTLNYETLSHLKIVRPKYEEQLKIANYLDKKCGEIDGLISDIEKEIEVLIQYRKSIITETVTKGLSKDVKLKNSGIEWAKQIPEHWEVSRIANVYKLRNQKVSDRDFEPLSVTMKGIFPQWENVAKSDAHDDRKLVRKGDFAINSRSDRRGSCGISDRDGSVSLINLVLQPLTNMNPNYYNWLFHTESFADEFYKWGHGIVNDLWTTNWQDMKRILIPQPPIQEQREIAEYLDKKCKEIDSILEDKNKQLETLESYKKSIIYEYVTGKKRS